MVQPGDRGGGVYYYELRVNSNNNNVNVNLREFAWQMHVLLMMTMTFGTTLPNQSNRSNRSLCSRIASTSRVVLLQIVSKIKSAYLFTSSKGDKTTSNIKSADLFTAFEGSKSTPKLKCAYLFTTFKSEKNTNFRKVLKMNKKN